MDYIKDNMPPLTEEEQKKVLEYAWGIQDCINERDKISIYACIFIINKDWGY